MGRPRPAWAARPCQAEAVPAPEERHEPAVPAQTAPVPAPQPAPAAAPAAAEPEPTPSFAGLQGAELVRAVCAWLMATAGKTSKAADSIAAGEERIARLVHTLSAAGLATGTAETEKFVNDFCAFIQLRYFDGITTDEHGAEARQRARENNRLIERLCSEQHFAEVADSLPLPEAEASAQDLQGGESEPEEAEGSEDEEDEHDDEEEGHEEDEDSDEESEEDELAQMEAELAEVESELQDVDEQEEDPAEMATEPEAAVDLTAEEDEEQSEDGDQSEDEAREEARELGRRMPRQHQQRAAHEELVQALRRQQQQRQQRLQEEAEAEAYVRQQRHAQRRYSDPFAAYHNQHQRQPRRQPMFASDPMGGWRMPQQQPRRVAQQPRMGGGFGGFGAPMMLF